MHFGGLYQNGDRLKNNTNKVSFQAGNPQVRNPENIDIFFFITTIVSLVKEDHRALEKQYLIPYKIPLTLMILLSMAFGL